MVLSALFSSPKEVRSRWDMERLLPCPALLSSCVSLRPPQRARHIYCAATAWLMWVWTLLAVSGGSLGKLVTPKVAQHMMLLVAGEMTASGGLPQFREKTQNCRRKDGSLEGRLPGVLRGCCLSVSTLIECGGPWAPTEIGFLTPYTASDKCP